MVNLKALSGRTVCYIYPMTGRPDTPLPEGWDMIPGARGCTPQACAFRDHATELRDLGVEHLFGISTNAQHYQAEVAERLHLPFPLLCDAELKFGSALGLPTMKVDDLTLLKRITMVIDDGTITKVFYPVFPPDRSVQDVIDWLKSDR